jgi:agmatinase
MLFWAGVTLLFSLHAVVLGHYTHDGQQPLNEPEAFVDPSKEPWLDKYGGQIDQPFSGPLSFAHLPYARCIEQAGLAFDITILGIPFDTAVSYRPGARFGPYAIRSGSRRQRSIRGWTLGWKSNPYVQGSDVIDCGTCIVYQCEACSCAKVPGDVPVSPFDNALALDQIETAYSTLLARPVKRNSSDVASARKRLQNLALDNVEHPRIIRSSRFFSMSSSALTYVAA